MNGPSSELVSRFPEVGEALPRISLGQWPTSVTPMARLGARIGIGSLAAKREDQSSAVYGGNKVRKLEVALGAARAAGATEVVTFGAVGSNHALATAIFGTALGFQVTTFMMPQPSSRHVRMNLLGHAALGARVVLCADAAEVRAAAAEHVAAETRRTGVSPHVIPFGGSDALTTLGALDAGLEFAAQVAAGRAEAPDVVYVPFGSMGTAVGVALGMAAAGLTPEVRAVRVVPPEVAGAEAADRLARGALALLGGIAPTFPVTAARASRLTVVEGFFGEGYGVFSPEGARAMRLVRETDGLALEGTYTAKTLAALIADAESGMLADRSVLYWHTYNSVDLRALTGGVDHHALPEALHTYFESPVQPLDTEVED